MMASDKVTLVRLVLHYITVRFTQNISKHRNLVCLGTTDQFAVMFESLILNSCNSIIEVQTIHFFHYYVFLN